MLVRSYEYGYGEIYILYIPYVYGVYILKRFWPTLIISDSSHPFCPTFLKFHGTFLFAFHVILYTLFV